MKLFNTILTSAIVIIVAQLHSKSDSIEPEPALNIPGTAMPLTEAVRQSDLIVEAKIIDSGKATPVGSGGTQMRDVRIQVSRWLKGADSETLAITYQAITFPPERKNDLPKAGKNYVFFIVNSTWPYYTSVKISPATEAQIALVRQLIEANKKK
jgi:hypothetical protein